MSDAEIAIKITADDEASNVVKNFGKTVQDTADNSGKANTSLYESFSAVQGAMLNLGQIAQGVHSIFETYEQSTLRLQNAQDRLENSLLRVQSANENVAQAEQKVLDVEDSHARDSITLEQAQLNLEKATNNYNKTLWETGKTSIDTQQAQIDLEKAQADVNDANNLGQKRASELSQAEKDLNDKQDALTIANNNAQRAQNQLTLATNNANWMYADMGIQLISVVGNLGTFINTIRTAKVATEAQTVATEGLSAASGVGGLTSIMSIAGPLAIGLAGIAEAYLLVRDNMKTTDDEIKTATGEWSDLSDATISTDQALKLYYYDLAHKTQQASMEVTSSNLNEDQTSFDKRNGWTGTVNKDIMSGKINETMPLPTDAQLTQPWLTLNTNVLTAQGSFANFSLDITNKTPTLNTSIDSLGTMIGSDKKGSFPIVYALGLAEDAWDKMSNTSVSDISKINESIYTIPTEYVTVHRIVTVYGDDNSVKGGAVMSTIGQGSGQMAGGAGR